MFWQSNSAEKRLLSEELLDDELVMFAMRNVSLSCEIANPAYYYLMGVRL